MTPPPIPAEVVELIAKFEHALFEQYPSMGECMGTINMARESLLSAIARAIAGGRGEPVAWILRTGHGDRVALHVPKCEIPEAWKPLYLAPPAPEKVDG